MRAEAPRPADVVVDRPAHDRVAEAEPSWRLRGADEVGGQQLVERVERGGSISDRRNQFRLERLAGDGRGIEHDPRLRAEHFQLVADRGGNRRRQSPFLPRMLHGQGVVPSRRIGGPHQLLEVKGVAATLAVQRGPSGGI